LAELADIAASILDAPADAPSFAYALERSNGGSRIVFRSKWKTGRRIELARILGDRLISAPGDHLFPSTRAYTYRQMKRSMTTTPTMYSKKWQKASTYPPLTIRTLLVSHDRISCDELEMSSDTAVA
jgi:hypothetical protein